MISQKEANKRAQFFYNELFGMNLIYPVIILDNDEFEAMLEEESKDRQIFEKRTADVHGGFSCAKVGYGRPDEATIYINKKRCYSVNKFNSTLIHELTHCALWWQGLDNEDGQYDFEHKLKELGLPSNWDHDYRGTGKRKYSKDKKEAPKEVMAKYEAMYQEFKKKVEKE